MLKYIESDSAIVGHASEVRGLFYDQYSNGYVGRFMLPLFSTKPKLLTKEYIENTEDPICFILKSNVYYDGLSLELVEAINKAWNEFYDYKYW